MVIVPKEYIPVGDPFVFNAFLIQYGRFHSDSTNTVIHLVFIPILVCTMMGLFEYTALMEFFNLNVMGLDKGHYHVLTFMPVFWCLLSMFYIKVEPIIGTMAWLFGITLWAIESWLRTMDESHFGGNLYYYILAVHIFGWTTQFVGHGVFEQRAPAITTNLLFLFIAPFFVCFEVMTMFGYKQDEVRTATLVIEADIAHYRLSKGMPMRKGIRVESSKTD